MALRGTSKGSWGIGLLALTLAACGGGSKDDPGPAGMSSDAGASSEEGSGASGGAGNDSEEAAGASKSSLGGARQTDPESNDAGAETTEQGGKGTGTSSGKAGAGGKASASLPDPDDTEAWLDVIGAACKRECDQEFELECVPTGLGNTLTCQLQCAATTAQLGDFCLPEYAAYIVCRADGGYDCVSGNVYPRSTCAKEQLAFSECSQHLGCKRACQKTVELGCNDESFASCVDSCTKPDPRVTAGSSICPYYVENIASCQAQYAMACAGDQLETPATCVSAVLNVAECIDDHSGELCEGWCFAAEKLGCAPEDCVADCTEKKADTTCGTRYQNVIDCALLHGDAACTDSGLAVGNSSISSICRSEAEQYQECLDGASTTP